MTLGDSRLGESKLGVPVSPTELPEEEETPRDRAEEVVKSAYDTSEDSQWDAFLNLISEEYEREYATITDIRTQQYVDTATQAQLDKIGSFVHTDRRHNEPDSHYRRRIKLQLPKHSASATINEILDSTTMLLDCDPSKLEVHETFDVEPARFDVFIREQIIKDANMSISDYINLIKEVKGAGIRVVATLGKQFTYRSKYEADDGINDPGRGYGGHNTTDLGGPYADLITSQHTPPGIEDAAE